MFRYKYQVKLAEKVYYICLLCLSFFFYKNPVMMNLFMIKNGQYSIPALTLSIVAFNMLGYYLEKKHQFQEKELESLKKQ